jgi:hypothetical protein
LVMPPPSPPLATPFMPPPLPPAAPSPALSSVTATVTAVPSADAARLPSRMHRHPPSSEALYRAHRLPPSSGNGANDGPSVDTRFVNEADDGPSVDTRSCIIHDDAYEASATATREAAATRAETAKHERRNERRACRAAAARGAVPSTSAPPTWMTFAIQTLQHAQSQSNLEQAHLSVRLEEARRLLQSERQAAARREAALRFVNRLRQQAAARREAELRRQMRERSDAAEEREASVLAAARAREHALRQQASAREHALCQQASAAKLRAEEANGARDDAQDGARVPGIRDERRRERALRAYFSPSYSTLSTTRNSPGGPPSAVSSAGSGSSAFTPGSSATSPDASMPPEWPGSSRGSSRGSSSMPPEWPSSYCAPPAHPWNVPVALHASAHDGARAPLERTGRPACKCSRRRPPPSPHRCAPLGLGRAGSAGSTGRGLVAPVRRGDARAGPLARASHTARAPEA